MYWIISIVVLIIFAFLIWASSDVGSNVYLKTICKGCTDERVVTLTFDDGPNEFMTPKILDVLKQYDIKATFFLVGEKVIRNQEIVKRIYAEKHTIGNHTYSHTGFFPLWKFSRVKQELECCNDVISEVVGFTPKIFRPPFGVTNPIIGKVVKLFGFTAIGWSVRSLDTVDSYSREYVAKRVIRKLHPGAIILLHDRCKDADKLLVLIIEYALSHNYKFVSLNTILNR